MHQNISLQLGNQRLMAIHWPTKKKFNSLQIPWLLLENTFNTKHTVTSGY